MPVSGSDLKLYQSHTAATDPSAASSLTSADAATGGLGGQVNTSALVVGNLHELFRPVTGDDTDGQDFYDYVKLYAKNAHPSLDLLTPRLWFSSLSGYTDDQLSISVALTGNACFLDDTVDPSLGREDYEEDTSGLTTADSAYPRITGSGDKIGDVADYSISNDPLIWTGGTGIVKLSTGAGGGNAVNGDKYVRVVGENAGTLVVGYILVPDGNAGTKYTAKDLRPTGAPLAETGGAADVNFTRVYCAVVHQRELGGVNVASSGGNEGDLSYVEVDLTDADGEFYVNFGGGDVSIGKLYCMATGGGVGQVFVPAFFEEGWVNSSSIGVKLPVIGASTTGTNEYNEKRGPYHAFWIRRKVNQSAPASSAIENELSLTGNSA